MKNRKENAEMLSYLRIIRPNLVTGITVESFSQEILNNVMTSLDSEVNKIKHFKCNNTTFEIANYKEVKQIMEVQSIVTHIFQYLKEVNKDYKETIQYSRLRKLNFKCKKILDTIDPI